MHVHGSGGAKPAWVTAEQVGDLQRAREQWNELEQQREEVRDRIQERMHPALLGALALGAGLFVGLPTALMFSFGRVGAIAGTVVGLGGASLALHHRELIFEGQEDGATLRSINSAQAQLDIPTLEARNAVGVEGYNAAVNTLLERFDHDGDGAINLANEQPLERDERVTTPGGSGPVQGVTSPAATAVPLLRAADANGNGDGRVTGDEIGRFLVDRTVSRLDRLQQGEQLLPEAVHALVERRDDASGMSRPKQLTRQGYAHQLRHPPQR